MPNGSLWLFAEGAPVGHRQTIAGGENRLPA
jgi:hypothetical protein